MKKHIALLAALSMALTFTACRDLFITDPDDIINEGDYITVDDEMYKGFMGIMTRMQQAADYSIILTDTRGDMLDVTSNAPLDLQKIYAYENTDGNSYADPAPYYAVVIACNDFVNRMRIYQQKAGDHMDETTLTNYKALISSTIRLKVWAYLKLGSIYGEAVWFNDPLEEKVDLSNTDVFTWVSLKNGDHSLADSCLNLLDRGLSIEGKTIPSNLLMDWASWINEEDVTTNYNHWKYMVPEHLSLKCELLLWRGQEADYVWVRDHALELLYKAQMGTLHDDVDVVYSDFRYACNIPIRTGADNLVATEYYRIFFNELYNASNFTNFYQVVTGIMYEYDHQQTNHIVEYFCPKAPGKYYLKPSHHALTKYAEADLRGIVQKNNMDVIDGDTCVVKYYYRRGEWLRNRIFEIHPVIPLFRGHDYHFYIAEAENHLHQWHQSEVVMNEGVTNEFADKILPNYWSSYYQSWFCPAGGYGDIGVANCVYGKLHDFPVRTLVKTDKTSSGSGNFFNSKGQEFTEEQRIQEYDLLIMDEAMNEYAFEGRAYAYICRMAERYGASAVVDRIAVKYEGTPYYDQVKNAILNGDYWVKWDLKADQLKNVQP